MSARRAIAIVVVCAAAGWVAAQDCPPAIIEAVAHVGDPAPGIPGATLAYLLTPQIDGEGNVLFSAFLDGPDITSANNQAIFYGPPGNVQKLIWESEQAPDMPEGVVIAGLIESYECMSEDDGWIAITPRLSGAGIVPGLNDQALLVGPPGDLRKVLQGGDQAPGCEPGVYLDVESLNLAALLSDNATVLLFGDLAGTGVTPYNDDAWWIGTRDNLELVYRDGMPAPGCAEGVVFLCADLVAHNDAGRIAFRGQLTGPGVTSTNDRGRWQGGPGALTKIARRGDPVPGMDAGVTWKIVAGGLPATNTAGELAEPGIIEGPGVSEADDYVFFRFFLGDSEGYSLLAREGDPAPEAGPGVYFEAFGGGWVNNRGEALYRVKYAGEDVTESNEWGVYFGPLRSARLQLRDGDSAPTFPADTTLWGVGAVSAFSAMNDVGDGITVTQIAGPGVTDDDKVVLWLRHRVLQRWIPLLRSGDSIGERTLYAADEGDFGFGYCNKTGGADGKPQSLNDEGMLATVLEFTDGTHGIYRISPPVFADADQDGDLDFDDWLYMAACWTGPGGAIDPACDALDLDRDGDVDLADQAVMQRLFQGEVTEEEGGTEWGSGSQGSGGYEW